MFKKWVLAFLFFGMQFYSYADCTHSVQQSTMPQDNWVTRRRIHDWDPKRSVILQPTKRKDSRTAVLIISPPHFGNGTDYTTVRWKLGQKVWEQYMHGVPNVDCYFLRSTIPRIDSTEEVWLEGDTIYVGDPFYADYGQDRILNKTIAAIEFLLPNYTHFIRTNLNTFLNLKSVKEYCDLHGQDMYTGPMWQGEWYVLGYGILFTANVAKHITDEYRRLEGLDIVSSSRSDDCVLTSLATGVYPLNDAEHEFVCAPSLRLGARQLMSLDSFKLVRLSQYGAFLLPPISLKSAINYCDQAPKSVMLYRIREGLDLRELGLIYQNLFNRVYPDLDSFDFMDYLNLGI
ncbi:MAG: hypothetical protein NTZ52_04060 [Chlamydiae bacterium]|nr:hypothetical protein [Chlamydiota bacterium]